MRAAGFDAIRSFSTQTMNILHVIGARPNFMKAAPVYKALREIGGFSQTLVHTGQHYDERMSGIFLRELGMPSPDVNLQVGSGSHARQTAAILERLEPVLIERTPDLVLVYGDVNSTVAAALVSAKLGISVGHVEAGLRSFDRAMPEEINRILTDALAGLLFTPSEDGNENLAREGVPKEKIHLVGNVMIDTLLQLLPLAEDRYPGLARRFGLSDYALVTLHRPSNVDDDRTLGNIFRTLREISREIPLLFPVHPRTGQRLERLGAPADARLRLAEPFGYLDFLALEQRARMVITDSGGIQEETTFLGVPCLTVRENTERPVTVRLGTNVLVGQDMACLAAEARAILAGRSKKGRLPPLWDGHAAARIARALSGKSSATFPHRMAAITS